MALAPSQSAKNFGTANNITTTLTNTPTTGDYLVAHFWTNDGTRTISSVQDGNLNNLTLVDSKIFTTGGGGIAAIYQYIVPATPSKSVKVTISAGTAPEMALVVQQWPGSGNSTPGLTGVIRGHATTTGTTTTLTFPSVTWAANDVAIVMYGDNGAATADNIGALNSFTLESNNYNNQTTFDNVPAYLVFTTGSTIPNAFTVSAGTGTGWAIVYSSFEATAGAAAFIAPAAVNVNQSVKRASYF